MTDSVTLSTKSDKRVWFKKVRVPVKLEVRLELLTLTNCDGSIVASALIPSN
jgi:hypothetical protein